MYPLASVNSVLLLAQRGPHGKGADEAEMHGVRSMATRNILQQQSATDAIVLHDSTILQRDAGPPSMAWVAENDRDIVVALNYEPLKRIEFQVRLSQR